MSKPTHPQEYQAITAVLSKYIEGCRQAKSSIMKPAFHDQATMFSIDEKGALAGGQVQVLFDGIDAGFKPSPDATSVITRIDITGSAASARVDCNDMSGFCFTDYFHLLKIDGQWTIVSKIFHTHATA